MVYVTRLGLGIVRVKSRPKMFGGSGEDEVVAMGQRALLPRHSLRKVALPSDDEALPRRLTASTIDAVAACGAARAR